MSLRVNTQILNFTFLLLLHTLKNTNQWNTEDQHVRIWVKPYFVLAL